MYPSGTGSTAATDVAAASAAMKGGSHLASGDPDALFSKQASGSEVSALLSRAKESFKAGTFSLFAAVNMCPQSSNPTAFALIAMIIEGFQLLWCALSSAVDYPWTDTYMSWPRDAMKIVRFDLLVSNSDMDPVPLAAAATLCSLAALLLALAVVLAVQTFRLSGAQRIVEAVTSAPLTSGKADLANSVVFRVDGCPSAVFGEAMRLFASRSMLLQVFNRAMALSTTVLLIPIMALLVGTFRCRAGDTDCFTGSHLASCILALVTLAIWLPLCVCYVTFRFPSYLRVPTMASVATDIEEMELGEGRGLDSQSHTAFEATEQAHNRITLLYLVLKVVLTTAFCMAVDGKSITRWALAASLVVAMSVLLVLQVWYMPFINARLQSVQVAVFSALAWSGLGLLITLIYDDNAQVVGSVVFLLGLPLVMSMSQLVLFQRRTWLATQPLAEVTDIACVELRVRLELSALASGSTVVGKFEGNDPSHGHAPDNSAWLSYRLQQLQQLMLTTCKSSTSSLLPLQTARMCAAKPQQRQRVAMLIQLAHRRAPPLDVQFGLYCLQSSYDESLAKDQAAVGVNRYLTHRALCIQATEAVITAARCQQTFFTQLSAPEPIVERLVNEGIVSEQVVCRSKQREPCDCMCLSDVSRCAICFPADHEPSHVYCLPLVRSRFAHPQDTRGDRTVCALNPPTSCTQLPSP